MLGDTPANLLKNQKVRLLKELQEVERKEKLLKSDHELILRTMAHNSVIGPATVANIHQTTGEDPSTTARIVKMSVPQVHDALKKARNANS